MEFVEVGRVGELPVGRARRVEVGGRDLALFHTSRGFFATDGRCPHRGGPLAEGDVIGDEIVCPWHLWGFNLGNGACAGSPEIAIATYEVRVDGERLLVCPTPSHERKSSTP